MAISIQPLGRHHDLKKFDCGSSALNLWLQQTARQHQEKGTSKTYVAVSEEAPTLICGFYAITMCEIAMTELPLTVAKKLPRVVTGFRLGRLATDRHYQGNKEFRIGETLLVDAMRRAKLVSQQIGGFALFVDAKDANAAGFYARYNFEALLNNPLKLFLTLSSIPG